MTRIHIPDAALEAGARAMFEVAYGRSPVLPDDDDTLGLGKAYARAAFEAMVKSWPGMQHHTFPESGSGDDYTPALDEIILPLPPQENENG